MTRTLKESRVTTHTPVNKLVTDISHAFTSTHSDSENTNGRRVLTLKATTVNHAPSTLVEHAGSCSKL